MARPPRMGVPQRRENVYWVRSPKALEVFKFTIYSSEIQPIYTHFNGDATRPCYLNRVLCDPKHSLLNLRWKGYVFGWDHEMNCIHWVQLTQEAANQLIDQLAGPQNIRGLTVQISRTKKKQGRMNCHVIPDFGSMDLNRMRRAPDVRLSVFNLWRMEPNNHPFTTSEEELATGDGQIRLAT